MEKWEVEEYKSVNSNNIAKLNELKCTLIENESIFNEILNTYNLSVAVFLNKYIS